MLELFVVEPRNIPGTSMQQSFRHWNMHIIQIYLNKIYTFFKVIID